MRATIQRAGGLPLESVSIQLSVTRERGLLSWQGSFARSTGPDPFEVGDIVRITLEDGREGNALVCRISINSDSLVRTFQFMGSGPLQ